MCQKGKKKAEEEKKTSTGIYMPQRVIPTITLTCYVNVVIGNLMLVLSNSCNWTAKKYAKRHGRGTDIIFLLNDPWKFSFATENKISLELLYFDGEFEFALNITVHGY